MAFLLVYITYPDLKTAQVIVKKLLKNKLIACANIFPIQSIYLSNSSIKNDNEFVSILKTSSKNWSKLQLNVKKLHPYRIPCIIKFNVNSNKSFESWINNET
jgi:periplasmic divalent cation tolerance protein